MSLKALKKDGWTFRNQEGSHRQLRELMRSAMEMHLRAMREDGDPEPSHIVDMLEVA